MSTENTPAPEATRLDRIGAHGGRVRHLIRTKDGDLAELAVVQGYDRHESAAWYSFERYAVTVRDYETGAVIFSGTLPGEKEVQLVTSYLNRTDLAVCEGCGERSCSPFEVTPDDEDHDGHRWHRPGYGCRSHTRARQDRCGSCGRRNRQLRDGWCNTCIREQVAFEMDRQASDRDEHRRRLDRNAYELGAR